MLKQREREREQSLKGRLTLTVYIRLGRLKQVHLLRGNIPASQQTSICGKILVCVKRQIPPSECVSLWPRLSAFSTERPCGAIGRQWWEAGQLQYIASFRERWTGPQTPHCGTKCHLAWRASPGIKITQKSTIITKLQSLSLFEIYSLLPRKPFLSMLCSITRDSQNIRVERSRPLDRMTTSARVNVWVVDARLGQLAFAIALWAEETNMLQQQTVS